MASTAAKKRKTNGKKPNLKVLPKTKKGKKKDYVVADIGLAEFGRKEMQLSEAEMPGLMELQAKYGTEKPLKGDTPLTIKHH